MSSQQPCPHCGNTSFFEEEGLSVCTHCGRRQEGGPVEADEEQFGFRRNVARRKQAKEKVKTSKVYRGPKARKLYLQAWQYISWRQCHALMKGPFYLKGELWNVVRSLWILRLSKLSDTFTYPEKAVLSEDRQYLTEEGTSESEHERGPGRQYNRIATDELPTLWETIALNYLGIILLQHPTRLATIYDGIRSETICFIRAIRHVPEEMSAKLPSEYRLALDTVVLPRPEDLQKAVMRTVTSYHSSFNMAIPSLNWKLVLFQYLEHMALPIEVFPTVMHLSGLVNYRFGYTEEQNARKSLVKCPEVRLMALVVVATKLMFPFEHSSVPMRFQSLQEPAAIELDWLKWQEIMERRKQDSETRLRVGREIEVTDSDVMSMQPDQLDQYLDWFQETWITKSDERQTNGKLLDMFPLKELPDSKKTPGGNEEQKERIVLQLKQIQASLSIRSATDENEIAETDSNNPKPGQRYQQFRKVDQLQGAAHIFHEEAARLCCTCIETLLRTVLQAERRLVVWQHESRRQSAFAGDEYKQERSEK